MINLYAYTYPKARGDRYILTKVGDTHRDVDTRLAEQGGAAEYEGKIEIGRWNNLSRISRDYVVHDVLCREGLWHKDGAGTEWFKIPANTEQEVFNYLDRIVQRLEGRRVRAKFVPRKAQQRALVAAINIIESGKGDVSFIANLAPRFGKTLWALSLFNYLTENHGNRVMLLPAYWLSVHPSFANELESFSDFEDIVAIDPKSPTAADEASDALASGRRIIVPISLHGEIDQWKKTHQWISEIPNDDIFMFADEGDFGTHTDNQVEKLDFLFD